MESLAEQKFAWFMPQNANFKDSVKKIGLSLQTKRILGTASGFGEFSTWQMRARAVPNKIYDVLGYISSYRQFA